MRWPFVSREAYEDRGRRLDELTEQLRERIARTDELTAQLTTQLVQMRKEGFSVPPQQGPSSPVADFPIEVVTAIEETCQGLPNVVRRIVTRKAVQMLANKEKPSDVAAKIRRGEKVPTG